MNFPTIAERLISLCMCGDSKAYKGALGMYELMTDLQSKSTCVEILHYLRNCGCSEFFRDCAYSVGSYAEFMDNVKHGTDDGYVTYYFHAIVIHDILKLFNNNVMIEAFNAMYKSEAAKFDERFRNALRYYGEYNEEKAIAMCKDLRKTARLMEISNDSNSVTTYELYLFNDDSEARITTYKGEFITEFVVI